MKIVSWKQNLLSLFDQADSTNLVCQNHSQLLPFRCLKCYQLTPWSNGAADIFEDWCDDCVADYVAMEGMPEVYEE